MSRESHCTGKMQYPSHAAASRATAAWTRRGKKGNQVYRCPYGDHWHIGRSNGRDKQKGSRPPRRRWKDQSWED